MSRFHTHCLPKDTNVLMNSYINTCIQELHCINFGGPFQNTLLRCTSVHPLVDIPCTAEAGGQQRAGACPHQVRGHGGFYLPHAASDTSPYPRLIPGTGAKHQRWRPSVVRPTQQRRCRPAVRQRPVCREQAVESAGTSDHDCDRVPGCGELRNALHWLCTVRSRDGVCGFCRCGTSSYSTAHSLRVGSPPPDRPDRSGAFKLASVCCLLLPYS